MELGKTLVKKTLFPFLTLVARVNQFPHPALKPY